MVHIELMYGTLFVPCPCYVWVPMDIPLKLATIGRSGYIEAELNTMPIRRGDVIRKFYRHFTPFLEV